MAPSHMVAKVSNYRGELLRYIFLLVARHRSVYWFKSLPNDLQGNLSTWLVRGRCILIQLLLELSLSLHWLLWRVGHTILFPILTYVSSSNCVDLREVCFQGNFKVFEERVNITPYGKMNLTLSVTVVMILRMIRRGRLYLVFPWRQ